ncbi:MAG: hypothetical protein FKY71_08635 [Spiribacter salinus]|uniref:DUF4189 domain-containing protein n=1 Tax=Spiribacter salinus TaxID=1335746 RepID=A0A540VRN5_9GAMM|nr:MAG: hypothetical protein FKY71_08635 [Spiribacter salinus]
MKTTLTAIALVLSAAAVSAQGNSDRTPPPFQGGGGGDARATAAAGASASAGAVASVRTEQNQGQLQGQLQGQGQRQSMSGNNSGANVSIRDRKQAPAVAAPGFSSGHPCGIAPASIGISFIGGAISGGGQVSDDACLLAQMGYTDAAMAMIASRNPDAFSALERTGHVARTSAPAVSSMSQPRPQARTVAYTSCTTRDDGALKVGVKRGASDAVKSRAVEQCRAALR